MRGSPLLRALLAFAVIAALGWPIWRLTRPPAPAPPAPTPPPAAGGPAIGLQLAFTTAPRILVVRHLEKELWRDSAPAVEMERELALPYPEQGVDLQLHFEWPEDGPLAAARIRLTDPAGEIHEKSVWGRGIVDEVLTFP